jgi:hypothetical protein
MFKLKYGILPGMVIHICNPSTWEVEEGGSLIQGHSGLHRETLSQRNMGSQSHLKDQSKLIVFVQFSDFVLL